jgi:hypothetical protein
MGLLQDRTNPDDILKGRFIRKVLQSTGADINKAQNAYFASRGFNMSNGWNDRTFSVTDNALDYSHLKKHRFVDMKNREVNGKKRPKKSHKIHNKIFWGNYNNVIRELSFGFSEEIKEELRKLKQ